MVIVETTIDQSSTLVASSSERGEVRSFLKKILALVDRYKSDPDAAKQILQEASLDDNSTPVLTGFLAELQTVFSTCPTLKTLQRLLAKQAQGDDNVASKLVRWLVLARSHAALSGLSIDDSPTARATVWQVVEDKINEYLIKNPHVYVLLNSNPHIMEQLAAFAALSAPYMVLKTEDKNKLVSRSTSGNVTQEKYEDGTILNIRSSGVKKFSKGQRTAAELDRRNQ